MTTDGLTRRFIVLRALRWLPVGIVLPFFVILPEARGLSIGEIGVVFAVHSAVAITFEVPSGALADTIGRRRVLLAGATVTTLSLVIFAVAESVPAFMASTGLLAAGRALISGALEAWYVDSLRALDPAAPLSVGMSRGTAAEAIAMAFGALGAGGLVTIAGSGDGHGAFSGYGIAALAGAVAAVVYLVAVAVLVDEPRDRFTSGPSTPPGRRVREIFATARAEAAASTTVRVVFLTGVAIGMAFTAVELLWQPRLADLLSGSDTGGLAFGAMAAASMVAVAAGASASPRLGRLIGLRRGYLLALGVSAIFVTVLGAPGSAGPFAVVYLLAYLVSGVVEPMHFELLNDAVGPTARATLLSAESLATQGGALTANLGVGVLAATQGLGAAWVVAGLFLLVTTAAVAAPLMRAARQGAAA